MDNKAVIEHIVSWMADYVAKSSTADRKILIKILSELTNIVSHL